MRGPGPPGSIASVADMTHRTSERRMVHLDIRPGDQLHGHVDVGDGDWRPFWGWLELMQAIEDAVATPETGALDRKDVDG